MNAAEGNKLPFIRSQIRRIEKVRSLFAIFSYLSDREFEGIINSKMIENYYVNLKDIRVA